MGLGSAGARPIVSTIRQEFGSETAWPDSLLAGSMNEEAGRGVSGVLDARAPGLAISIEQNRDRDSFRVHTIVF